LLRTRAGHRRRNTLIVLGLAASAFALVFGVWGGAGRASSSEALRPASCPSGAFPGGPLDAEAVLASLRRQLPSLYKGLTDMGDPVPINPRTYEVVGLIRLGPAPPPPFAQGLRKRALKLCKRGIVDRSWAAAVQLDLVQLPASSRIVFLARTSRGWTAWYHS
jgi:hypothetical protein